MAAPSWQVAGQYYETCSCDFACPCITGQLAVMPTKGFCTVAMAFQIERGSYGTVALDGLGFIVLLWTPEEMGKGNWSVGVIADARASAEQLDAITSIASGFTWVGCEPALLDPEDGALGLSEIVKNSIPEAIHMIEALIEKLLAEAAQCTNSAS